MKPIAPAIRQQSTVGLSQSRTVVGSPVGFWNRCIAWVRSWFEIPYGYEDEKGFHYGVEPVRAKPSPKLSASQKVNTDRASDVIPSPCPVPLNDTDPTPDDHRHTV